jgi:tetratricopeptide (TPR) repeat protein
MKMEARPPVLHDAGIANLLARLREEPDSREVLLDLAIGFNARSMPDEARATCQLLLELEPDDERAWYESIIAHSFGGAPELEPLLAEVQQVADDHPDAAWAKRNLALLYYYLERDEDTRETALRALSLDPTDGRSYEVLAYLAYTVGDLDGAVEHGIKAVELDPANFRALHWLGECYIKLDAAPQAVRYFQRALRIEDCFFFAAESLAALYLRESLTFGLALQCFAKVLSVNPRYFPVYFRLADAFIQAERFVEAAAQVTTVLHLHPDSTAEADAHQYLGLIQLLEGQPGAKRHFMRALEIDPRFAAAHHYLGVLAEQSGDIEDAEACYRRAIASDTDYSLPHVRLGYLCFDRKEYENARRHFDAAAAIDPEDHLAQVGLGEIARWRRDYGEQLERCERAAELSPDDSNVRNQLGTAFDALGRHDEAVAEYERALELDPMNRHAANNLGFLYERLLKDASGRKPASGIRGIESLKTRAIEAWKRRLLICRDTRSSTRGARTHLEKLGVEPSQVDEWLRAAVLS